MGIMRWTLYNRLKDIYGDMVHNTYGYITKNTRIAHGLPKAHHVDARCISGNPASKSDGVVYYQKKIRCHNRQIHKLKVSKGGVRKRNQAPYIVKGFRLFDKVIYGGQECFVFGRRTSGYFDLRKLDGTVVHRSASYKKLRLLEQSCSCLTERRAVWRRQRIPPRLKKSGYPSLNLDECNQNCFWNIAWRSWNCLNNYFFFKFL